MLCQKIWPDTMSEYVSDRMPDRMPEYMSDRLPGRMPEHMSDKLFVYLERMYVQMWGSLEVK